ncbi:MAG: tetratricopeptide repeat protein [Candidatus Eisenbacteria bacterium]
MASTLYKFSSMLLIVAATALTGLLLVNKISDYDTWFHLRAGEWLLSGGGFPQEDPFSFTADARWINLSTVFQIPSALAHRLGGTTAVILFNTLILAAALALIARRGIRAGAPHDLIVALLALATLASAQRLLVRPESLSLLYLVVALLLVEAGRARRTRLLWGFPLLQLIWVNSEALFPLGLGVLGAGALGAFRRSSLAGLRVWLPVLAVSAAVSVINPYGVTGALAPLRFLGMLSRPDNVAGGSILELRSLFDPAIPQRTVLPFYVFCVALLGIIVPRLRRLDLFHFIVLTALAALALMSVRNIPLFAFAGSFVAVGLLAPGSRRLVPSLARTGVAVVFVLLALGTISSSLYHHLGIRKLFGVGIDPRLFPQQTVSRLAPAPPARVMNDQALGHYLLWRLWPATRVSRDGRSEVYGDPRLAELQACFVDPNLFNRFARRSDATTAVIAHGWPHLMPLLAALNAHPDWVLTAYDDAAMVFQHSSSEVRKTDIAAPLPPPPDLDLQTEQPLDIPHPHRRSFAAAWLSAPGRVQAETRMARSRALLQLSRSDAAVEEAFAAVQAAPWIAAAFDHLGAALVRAGRLEDAREAFRRSLDLAPRAGDAHANLAAVEAKLAELSEAERRLRQALERDPDNIEAGIDLSKALHALNRRAESESLLLVTSTHNPDNPRPLIELGHLAFRRLRHAEAARHYTQAALRGGGSQAYLWAALSFRAAGSRDEAEESLARARDAASDAAMRAQIDSIWTAPPR